MDGNSTDVFMIIITNPDCIFIEKNPPQNSGWSPSRRWVGLLSWVCQVLEHKLQHCWQLPGLQSDNLYFLFFLMWITTGHDQEPPDLNGWPFHVRFRFHHQFWQKSHSVNLNARPIKMPPYNIPEPSGKLTSPATPLRTFALLCTLLWTCH